MAAIRSAAASPPANSRQRSDRAPRLRVAQIAARLPVGGMENVVASLASGLDRKTFETRIWCLEEADELGHELRAAGQPLVEFHRAKRRDLGLIFRLRARARAERIDVLHCHDELSWFYGTLAAALLPKLAVVTTMHGRRRDISRRHMIEQRLLAARTDAVVSVSTYLRDQLVRDLQMPCERITLIINGVRMDPPPISCEAARRLLGLPLEALVVGCVGELSPVKHFDLAIDAFASVAASMPAAHLVLVGNGACRAELEAQGRALGLSDRVHFEGVRRDVPSLWPAFDVYVCSSHYEGTSLSVLEAMAAARAVVLTAVGGNTALVTDRVTGRLVPTDDSAAMSGALIELLRDEELRRTLGANARAVVNRRFSLDATLDAYAALYRRVAAARRSAPRGSEE